jgi:hypothetical protein
MPADASALSLTLIWSLTTSNALEALSALSPPSAAAGFNFIAAKMTTVIASTPPIPNANALEFIFFTRTSSFR